MTRWWGRRALIAALAAGALLVTAADGALAATPTPAPQPGPPAQGVDGLVPAPPGIQQGNQPTLPERYPVLAYSRFNVDTPNAILGGFADPSGTAANVLANWWAGVVILVVAGVAMLTTHLLEWIFTFDIAGAAGAPLSSVVHNLADQVYTPLLALALGLLAIWLVWQLLARRRTIRGLQGMGWALTAMVLAGVYFSAPAQVLSGIDGFTGVVSRQMLSAIGSGDPAMSNRAGDPSFSQGDPADAELRMFADRYWRTFVFAPWSVAALGDVPTGQRYGEELLAKQANMPSNFDADFHAGASDNAKAWYGGRYGDNRLLIALLALLVVVLSSVLYLVIAGTVVVTQLALLILLMLAPLFLLVGIQPGGGRRMLIRWAELAAGTLLIRVLSAAFAAVLLVLSGLISQIGAVNWLVAVGLQLALVVAAFVYRKPFLRIFGQVASMRVASSHISHPRTAQGAHRGMEWLASGLHRRRLAATAQGARQTGTATAAAGRAAQGRAATAAAGATGSGGAAGAAGASGAGAAAAAGAGPAALALLALEAGKWTVQAGARATRRLQGAASPFVMGGSATPPRATFASTPTARRIQAMFPGAPAPAPAKQPASGTQGGAQSGRSRPARSARGGASSAAGKTYTNHHTGQTVTVNSPRIVLPGAWRNGGRP